MTNLSILSLVLGVLLVGSSVFVLAKPEKTVAILKAFPRSLAAGYIFLIISTIWFLWNFHLENVADFAALKRHLYVVFIVIAVGVGLYVKDFLAVRAYSVFLFLVAKLIYDVARYADSSWALLFPSVATVLVFFGMWFTISPWRMRDMLLWLMKYPVRLKVFASGRAVLGVVFLILGLLKIQ